MRWVLDFFGSSIGKKQWMALSGLALCGFLLAHLTGNLLMVRNPDAFDAYAEFLTHHPLLVPAELGLAALFLGHIVVGLLLAWENWRARPVGYSRHVDAGGSTLGSSTMKYTGLLMLAFLCMHVVNFKFMFDQGGSLFDWVVGWFQLPWYAALYLAAVAVVGVHLSHGVQSAFQTFGVHHARLTPGVRVGGLVFAFAVGFGFGLLPVWGYFLCGG